MKQSAREGPHRTDHHDGSFAAADLLQAALGLASDLDLPTVLHRFVTASAALTGAAFGAINVLDPHGRSDFPCNCFHFASMEASFASSARAASSCVTVGAASEPSTCA